MSLKFINGRWTWIPPNSWKRRLKSVLKKKNTQLPVNYRWKETPSEQKITTIIKTAIEKSIEPIIIKEIISMRCFSITMRMGLKVKNYNQASIKNKISKLLDLLGKLLEELPSFDEEIKETLMKKKKSYEKIINQIILPPSETELSSIKIENLNTKAYIPQLIKESTIKLYEYLRSIFVARDSIYECTYADKPQKSYKLINEFVAEILSPISPKTVRKYFLKTH